VEPPSSRELSTWALPDAGPYGGQSCGFAWDGRDRYFYLCSNTWSDDDYTDFSYERYAGRVLYHGSTYSRRWDGTSGSEFFYTTNGGWKYGLDPVPAFGDDFAMRVRIHDGDEVFRADPAFPLNVRVWETASPYSCSTFENTYAGYGVTSCSSFTERIRTAVGQATG
jgi:hypothetical protein